MMLGKRCVIEEAKKKQDTWRKRRSFQSNWKTFKRIISKSAKIWWKWLSLHSFLNGYSQSSALFISAVFLVIAKTNWFASFTILSLLKRCLWWATTRSIFRKCSQITRLVLSILSLSSYCIMFAFTDMWMSSKKKSTWSTSVLFIRPSI